MTPEANAIRIWLKELKSKEGKFGPYHYLAAIFLGIGVFKTTEEWFESIFWPYGPFNSGLPIGVILGFFYALLVGVFVVESFFSFRRDLRIRRRLGIKVNPVHDLIAFSVLLLGAYWGITQVHGQFVTTRFASGAALIAISFVVPIAWIFYRATSALLEMKGFIAVAIERGVLRIRNGQLEAVENDTNTNP